MSRTGDAIDLARQRMGWTGRELARRSGFSASFICDVQAGRRDLSPESLLRICNQFPDEDGAAWLWLLLADLWSPEIAATMRAHVVRPGSGGGEDAG